MEMKRKRRKRTDLTLQLDRSTIIEQMRESVGRQASLVVIGGIDLGCSFPLSTTESTVLGRDNDCEGIIHDDGISKRHAEVVFDNRERYIIRDLGSTNGIYVDGHKIQQHVLKDGDKILIGRRTILKFMLQDPVEMEFQRQMYQSSVRDPLTGAYNRKHFDERISSEISFTRRHRVPLTLIMIDLDYFKKVNDTYGHQAGDQVLIAVSDTIMDALREEDIFSRYGGEEFMVIARGIDEIGGMALGERLRCMVEEMKITTPDEVSIPVTISLGVGTVPGGMAASSTHLLKLVDDNLYRAKKNGRNCVVTSCIKMEFGEDST